jgi:uncharacterized protein (DUF4415 family)
MSTVIFSREPGTPLTEEQRRELQELAAKPASEIDTSDIPPLVESEWAGAVRGRFYRPVKQAVSFRIDADVLAWLKKDGDGYQTRANQILRARMLEDLKRVG